MSEIAELRRVLDDQAQSPLGSDVLVESLETAYEELRVADEEVQAQHLELQTLRQEGSRRLQVQDRLLARLPVAVVSTDAVGTIRACNAAAQELLGLARQRLLGKPLAVFLRPHDRSALRDLVRQLPALSEALTSRLVLAPRDDLLVEVQAYVTSTDTDRFTWMLTPLLPGGTGDGASHPEVIRALAAFSGMGLELRSVEDLVHVAVQHCADALLGEWEVSLVLGEPIEPRATGTSSLGAQSVDGAQLRSGEGPCQDAYTSGGTVTTPDVHTDARWPALHRALGGLAVGPVIAVPLQSHQGVVGALNVYGSREDSLDAQTVQAAEVLGLALGALVNEIDVRRDIDDLERDLRTALESRATIDQAKGIVMADQHCSPDQAFAFLTALSSKRNVKVRDLAAMLVEQVIVPPRPTG